MNEENKNLEEILKKQEENIRKSIGEDVKRHIDVMLEGVRSDFKVFGEGLSDLSVKVDNLTDRVDEMDGKIEVLDMKVVNLTEDVADLKEKTGYLLEDMDQVKTDIVDMKKDIKEINTKLDKKADKEIVEDHKFRMIRLEKAAGVA